VEVEMTYDWTEGNRLEILESCIWKVMSEDDRKNVDKWGMPSLPFYRGEPLTVEQVLATVEIPTLDGTSRRLTDAETANVLACFATKNS
jgi:hypothetical protein